MSFEWDFVWTRGLAYEIATTSLFHPPSADDPKRLVIRQKGERFESLRPLDLKPSLYSDFARLDGTPEACLRFAKTWGLLVTPAGLNADETLFDWRLAIKEVNAWIAILDLRNEGSGVGPLSRAPARALRPAFGDLWRSYNPDEDDEPFTITKVQRGPVEARGAVAQLKVTSVELGLAYPTGGKPFLVLRPDSLLDGMMVQMAKVASMGAGLRECQQCGTHFEAGGKPDRGRTKRSDTKFCSDQCRARFHYERRAK